MDAKSQRNQGVVDESDLETDLSRIKLSNILIENRKHQNEVKNQDVLCSETQKLDEIYSTGVSSQNYHQFCNLFSKVVFNIDADSGFGTGDDNLNAGTDQNQSEYEDSNYACLDDEFDRIFWDSLEWFVNVLNELNGFESLGFGVLFLLNNLKFYSENSEFVKSKKMENNVEILKKWIDFINLFRDANNSIFTTYLLLDRMQIKLNYIRYKSVKILLLKHTNKNKLISQNKNIATPINNSFENFEYTPISTPLSVSTTSCDNADVDLLNDIWDTKLCKMRIISFNKFRSYIVNIIEELKKLYPTYNYYQIVHFILYTNRTNFNTAIESRSSRFDECLEDEKYVSSSSSFDVDFKDEEDVFEYLKKYYSEKNMNEEREESYVKRISELSKRLIPKFAKMITRIPVYYEAYLNALVCNNIQDGTFQLISSTNNFKEVYKDKDSFRDGKDSHRDDEIDYKSWLHRINLAKVLNKTNLEVVDVVRCSFNNSRKLVVFTQGLLKDLFSPVDYYPHYYKDGYKEGLKDKDSFIIKSETKEDKSEKEEEDIFNLIYYSDDNLSQVASEEIERVIQQHMPSFNWYPKLIKYQYNLNTPQSSYVYNVNSNDVLNPDFGEGTEYIEYFDLEEKVWLDRLSVFNRVNERNIRNLLVKRNNNLVRNIKYDSSNLLLPYNIPFRVLLDYNNYVPIKYIYNPDGKNDGLENQKGVNRSKRGNKGVFKGKDKKNREVEKDWLIRLFNNSSYKLMKNSCIDIEIERDLFPGFYLFNNFRLNCFILPIHENKFQNHETFQNFSKLMQNRVDLIYPSYSHQISQVIFNSDFLQDLNINYGSVHNVGMSRNFTGKYGDHFTTYHKNLTVGNKDKMIINFVFHLVCCSTSHNDDINPIEYAEDTEVILSHIKKIKPILDGLEQILSVCNKFNIHTLHMPASLKCCYKINQFNNHIIQSDFQHTSSHNQYNLAHHGSGNLTRNDGVIECNSDYVRCLAVVSYLASLLNKNKYSIKNFNLIFPRHLKHTLLPKTAANLLTMRVHTF